MFRNVLPGLPDPDLRPEFYAAIPAKRLVAWLVDLVLIALLTVLVLPFTAFTGLFYLPFLYMVVGFAYRTVALARNSATPGMRLVAIEFRDRFGHRFDFGHALLHTLGYTVSISMVLPQVVSVVLMLTGSRAQGLTDIVMGTAAINRPAEPL
ncbi:MAG: RDD family protein [Gemmobacter sp.]